VRDASRLYQIGYKAACLERLWISGTLFDGPATRDDLLATTRDLIGELQKVASELEAETQPTTGAWLD
jgi:hypothetical protein